MKMIASVAILSLLAATPTFAGTGAGTKVVAFNASVRVDVDAIGKPVKVEAPQDLPAAIRSFIEKRVATWRYEPARHDGVAVPATTFVSVGACAIPTPAGDGYSLGLDFKGNGPGLVSANGQMPPPAYPRDLMRQGAQGVFNVTYTVQPDGSTHVDDVESMDGSKRYLKSFRPALTAWIEQMQYQPEIVGGKHVPTRISFPVEFVLKKGGSHPAWREHYLAELQARAIASNECKLATGTSFGPLPVALDSPVKVTPTPAS